MINELSKQDQHHRKLALDPTQSFIVQAPAGSGKTELLVQRFLILLNRVKTPEEILAITFTKKSANEMRSRVIKALKQAANKPEPETDHAKQTWVLAKKVLMRDKELNWNIINNPNQLSIQTIDSLCSYLTKQLPLLSHFGSQPDITENPIFLYREAVHELLLHLEENASWSEAIANILFHLDNDLNKLHDLLITLLAKRDQWLPYLHLDTKNIEIKNQLENHLALVVSEHLSLLKKIIPKESIAELISIVKFAADHIDSNANSPLLLFRELTGLPGTQASDKFAWIGLATILLTKSFTWRKRLDAEIGFPPLSQFRNIIEKNLHQDYRQRFTDLIDLLSQHENLRLALVELIHLPDVRYQDSQWEILESLLQILKVLSAQLRVIFQKYGQIDFIENAQAALLALGNDENPTDLALLLDYQIQHILIDEFQDTSFTQYQLLEKLITGWEEGDGRSLFVVGDPMQSIYRFREAEVGLFMRMCQKGIANIQLHPLTLSVNFRSTGDIVTWNNKHFQAIFPPFNNMANGAVVFNSSIATQISESSLSVINIEGLSGAHEQAHRIITQIQTLQSQSPHDKIAILVRSRTHLSAIIPALKKAKIAYRAVDIDPLTEKQHIQDLISLASALLHPADRIAWLAILRAPWCGITLNDLLLIANQNPHACILEQLDRKDIIDKLSSDGQQRINKFISILKSKLLERERQNLRVWIESTWLQLGGPACLASYDDYLDVEAFFKLLDEFNQINETLTHDTLKEKINQLYAPAQHDDKALQIMTIHTAKGLEFDTVIIPHLEKSMPHDEKALLTWLERPLANDISILLLASIHSTGSSKDSIYEYINRQHKIKSDHEVDRLFYVATTRAKKNLFLYFNVNENEDNDFRIATGSFLSKIWPLVNNDKDRILTHTSQPILNQSNSNIRYTKRLSYTWNNPIKCMDIPVTLHQQRDGFHLINHNPRIIGSGIHRSLQSIADLGINWWMNASTHQQLDYFAQQLKQLGLLPQDMKSAIQLCQQAIQQTLNDARGRWILAQHHEAKSEFAITAILDNKIENLVIDRTFIDENNVRWIIDYKTTDITDKHDLNKFLHDEQEKYRKKMQEYYQAMKLIDNREIRLGLYFPLLSAWCEYQNEIVT